ncbi:hypothetical protein C8F01DRAFT_1059392 [Mycena amicta]|nr:hypothetical protein C8F01DRAFT_1059392 [Mycena amicta]
MTDTHNRSATEATIVGATNGISGLPASSSPTSPFQTVSTNPPSNIIPPEHPFRTLVLCFDGTGDQFDADNSNIIQLFSLLPKSDRSRQMVYYQAGIGTYTIPQVADPLWSRVSKFIDGAIAWNLDAHVMGGYEFLMQNYTANDRICIFGFSRGAYIARSLAGMIHKVGLLPACNHQQVPFAYKMYTSADETGWKQSNAFKKAFSIDVDIEFVGVWDTVSSVGLIPRRLPFTTSNTIVRTFRHAMALDERRAKFKVNLWNRPNHQEQKLGINAAAVSTETAVQPTPTHTKNPSKKMSHHLLEERYARDRSQLTDIEEVWFAGCHCDVGGGSVSNETTHNLARIPLRWMIRECFKTNSGIMFDCDGLRAIGMDPDALYPFVKPRPPALSVPNDMRVLSIRAADAEAKTNTGTEDQPTLKSEEEHDLTDSLRPIYDQLSLAWFWWVLELIPLKQRYQRGDAKWMTYFGFNLGRPRFIPKQRANGVKVHRSVKARMETEMIGGGRYKPKAAFDLERTTWVD